MKSINRVTSASRRLRLFERLVPENQRRLRKRLDYPEIKGSRPEQPASFADKLKSFSFKFWCQFRFSLSWYWRSA